MGYGEFAKTVQPNGSFSPFYAFLLTVCHVILVRIEVALFFSITVSFVCVVLSAGHDGLAHSLVPSL